MERNNNSREILKEIIENFSTEKFIHFFRNKNTSFRPMQEDLLNYNDGDFTSGEKIGEIEFQDSNLIICSFQVLEELSERSGKKKQYELGKRILKETNTDAGIFIFYDGDGNFRFSLIYTEYFDTKRKFSYFKRFTYFVSPRLTNKTFLEQIGEADFSSIEKIKEAFSVEPVTKLFYEEIQNWYFWTIDKIKFPEDYKYNDDLDKDKEIRNATNLIRLITRIIFIWFIKEKGLIPDILFDREELKGIVRDFNEPGASNYYNAILQNLFFATLNSKMEERGWAKDKGYPKNKSTYGVKNLYRYEDKFLINEEEVLNLFKEIPFLNGGLFDCLDKEDESGKVIYIDGFSRNPNKQAIISDYLFFQQNEIRVDLSKYGLGSNKPVRGLIEILKSYNFTIDENTPIDQEVALDPELLGKVFENLLASYNPETATTARKATGSYYTPREIVDYMVDESLKEYFKTKLPKIKKDKIELLLSYSEEIPEFSEEEKQKIIFFIDKIKILDPACGSGAFPMGILHKLVYILQKIDPDNKYWYELQYKKTLKASEEVFKEKDKLEREEMLKEINEAFDESINYPDYARKLYLIENCIYGVDIQPIAIQISKLRFFISLVIDQKVDRTKENLGIRALPNLETKFVSANTLIGLERPKQFLLRNPEIEKKERELKELRHRYFAVKTRTQKQNLQEKDRKIRQEIVQLLVNDGWGEQIAKKIASFDIFDQNASANWFDPEWMFGVVDGFDIVIGNPPYVRADRGEKHLELRKKIMDSKQYQTLWEKWDLYVAFIERGFNLLCNKGILEFIIPDAYMSSKYAEKSRDYFLNNAVINRINFCSDIKIFEQAVRNIIIEFKREINPNHIPVRIKHIGKWDNSILLLSKKQSEMGRNTFKLDSENKTFGDLSNTLTWGEICYVSKGMVLNADEIRYQGDFKKEDLISDYQDKIHFKKYIEAKWTKRYYIEVIKYLEWNTDRVPQKISRPTFPELYVPEKIIKGRMTDAVYDDTGLLCNDSCFVSVLWKDLKGVQNRSIEVSIKKDFKVKTVYPLRNQLEENSKQFNLKYLLAVLNSKFAYKFLNFVRRSQIGFYPDDLKKLPIKKISLQEQQPFITLVDQILSAKKQNPQADTSELECQIDQMVYKLYGLTEEEIKIMENSRRN